MTVFHFLRQQIEKPEGQPNWCLADFIAPKSSTGATPVLQDYIGAFAVTTGLGVNELAGEIQGRT